MTPSTGRAWTPPIEGRDATRVFERVANFRDLGGFRGLHGRRIQTGRLYRSATLDWMTRSDARFAHAELGVRTVIDLRAAHEVRAGDDHPLFQLGVARAHLPFSNALVEAGWSCLSSDSLESYLLPLQHARDSVRAAVDQLAVPDTLPAVVHCAAGKDRTGTLVALLLEVLGVSDEDIEADYRASEPHLARAMTIAGGDPEVEAHELEIYPDSLLGTLAWVRETFGGAEAYFLVCGVEEPTIRRLRESLLE